MIVLYLVCSSAICLLTLSLSNGRSPLRREKAGQTLCNRSFLALSAGGLRQPQAERLSKYFAILKEI